MRSDRMNSNKGERKEAKRIRTFPVVVLVIMVLSVFVGVSLAENGNNVNASESMQNKTGDECENPVVVCLQACPGSKASAGVGYASENDFETVFEYDLERPESEAGSVVGYTLQNGFTTAFDDQFSTNPWSRWDYHPDYPIGWSSSGEYVYLPYSTGDRTTWNTPVTHNFPSFPLDGCVEGKL